MGNAGTSHWVYPNEFWPMAVAISEPASKVAPDPVRNPLAPMLIWNRFCNTRLRPKLFRFSPPVAPYMAATTINMGSRMAALAVVAEMKADKTRLMTIKLIITPKEFLPNRNTNQSAKRLATCVLTSMLARMNDRMFSHMTGCPNCAKAVFSVVTPVSTMDRITKREVR